MIGHMCLIFNSPGKPWLGQLIYGLILSQIHAVEMIIENGSVPFIYQEHSVGLL